MERSYVEQRDSGYWMRGTRISLDSIVYAFKRGAAPESIQRAFPLLTLEEIYGAMTFYLAHEQEIDTYLAQAEAAFAVRVNALNAAARTINPALFQRLEHMRQARETTPRWPSASRLTPTSTRRLSQGYCVGSQVLISKRQTQPVYAGSLLLRYWCSRRKRAAF